MSKERFDKLVANASLLHDLNDIVNFCVGNQDPTDVSVTEIDTLPELIAYIESHPGSKKHIEEGINQLDKLSSKVLEMKNILSQWLKMVDYLKK